MEDENQVFGKAAEAVENNDNLESEDFNFYRQNKEEAKKNIDSSAKDLTDFIDLLIRDVPAPSEEEIKAGTEKILRRTHPVQDKTENVKTDKKKKVTLKVLFLAAVLSVLSFSCLLAVGNSRNISIENGFMAFARETVQVVFFGEDEKEYISVDSLLADLKTHGYKDILFPEEFIVNSDIYKVSVPEYLEGDLRQATFDIYRDEINYKFIIYFYSSSQQIFDYVEIDNAHTVTVNDVCVYVFEFDDNNLVIEFMDNRYRYSIKTNSPDSEAIALIKTINKGDK